MKQNGNALFLILIAVALFAALSYAITSTGRGGGNVNNEQFEINLSRVLQTMEAHYNGIIRMKMIDGVADTEFSFEGGDWPGWVEASYANGNCTSAACKVFASDGGGVNADRPPVDISKDGSTNVYYAFTGNIYAPGFGADDQPELLMGLLVSQETCIKVNERLGIDNPSGAPPQLPGSALLFAGAFDGTYTAGASGINNTLPAELEGKSTGCFNQQHGFHSNDYAWIYSVMLAR